MSRVGESHLASRAAAALFVGAGIVGMINSSASSALGAAGTNLWVLRATSVLSLASAFCVWRFFSKQFPLWVRLGVAAWGMSLLVFSATVGQYATTPQSTIVFPVFLMMALVWLGLATPRGVSAGFAVLALGASALGAAVPDSRMSFSNSAVVIVVSVVVAETVAWAMSEVRRREQRLAILAATDPLTGLLNRGAFADRLSQCCASRESRFLGFVDLNGFKHVNDTFGHHTGDAILVEVAHRLRGVARAEDVVGRFGGDEFVILFRSPRADVDADALVERVRLALAKPWTAVAPIVMTASVGIVEDRDGSRSPDDLLREADTAMYSRKHGTAPAFSTAMMTSHSLSLYRAAMDGLGGSFTVLRAVRSDGPLDWQIIEANALVRSRYRMLVDEPVGTLLSSFDRVADNSALNDVYERALQSGSREEFDTSLSVPGEAPLWRRVVVVPIEHDVVAVMTFDVTAEKAAQDALREAENRSRSIVESAPDAIMTVDATGHFVAFNRAAESIFGVPGEEVIGRPYQRFTPDESLLVLRDALAQQPGGSRVEVLLNRVNGERFAAQVALSTVGESAGMSFTAIVRDISEQKRSEAELLEARYALDYEASHDPLTGLLNRAGFIAQIATALDAACARESNVGMLLVDLDHFKRVNDALGHRFGDRVLASIAERISGEIRPNDAVARLGADEFGVLCADIPTATVARDVARRLMKSIAEPLSIDGQEVFVTASIGVAVSANGAETPETLLRHADMAMYRAKELGRSRIEKCDTRAHRVSGGVFNTVNDLHRALDREELVVYYQPIVALDTGLVIGFEALVRWQHPERGLVPPDQFIGLAEESGLIVPLGEWVLETACRQTAHWESLRNASASQPPLAIHVNLSPRQLDDPSVASRVSRIVARSGVAPTAVCLEITENSLMRDPDRATKALEKLRGKGVRISVDDFGTGYSSLAYLKRFPIESLKIDRSFVAGIGVDAEDTTIVEAIIGLAHALDITVIAEGLETPKHLEVLRALRCDSAQGYLLGRPLPAETVGAHPADDLTKWQPADRPIGSDAAPTAVEPDQL